ncbi:MAG: DUF6508 domain-containing protein [Alphaproteobacteria bacterium]
MAPIEKPRPGRPAEAAEGQRSARALRAADLADLLARMAGKADGFGRWHRETRDAHGHIGLPWFEYSEDAQKLLAQIRNAGLLVAGFDWAAWSGRNSYLDDPNSIDTADREDCRRLLTALIRGDRFNEGLLFNAFESGLLRRLVDRLAATVDD